MSRRNVVAKNVRKKTEKDKENVLISAVSVRYWGYVNIDVKN